MIFIKLSHDMNGKSTLSRGNVADFAEEKNPEVHAENRTYIAIDLKSFYASVECVERGLDSMTTNLVVADESRTEKTICLAVSPSLKKYGIPGRARLFEVISKCKEIKALMKKEVEYIVAPPRMQLYMDYSCRIYQIYLRYVSHEDIHIYSIDEVFMDVTDYLHLYKDEAGEQLSAHDLAKRIIKDVKKNTGIIATAGVGTNLYLAKIAMDMVAKHVEADEDGVRIAELDELSYRRLLWEHRPVSDFWRIGRGIRKKLEANGMYTMGDIARMSVSPFGYGTGEDYLFKLFGVDAELLIDHAWGIETCTMKDIKAYRPENRSVSSGQVLSCGYDYKKCRIVIKEMTELQALELVSKKLMTDSITIDLGYDRESKDSDYNGEMALDPYGRTVPKPAHGSHKLSVHTSSTGKLTEAALGIYDRIADRKLLIKRITIAFGNILDEDKCMSDTYEQLSLFTDYSHEKEAEEKSARERKLQETMLAIRNRFGKNAILKGTNLEEGATTIERNGQIGGHKA